MNIYSSDKAVPYVYVCTHKETNQFYIGYRMANVRLNVPSHLDLPEYKTSSTTVRPDWENYTWTIVAEFFDPSDAYTFEQQMIFDNWENPLLLNEHYNLGENQFRTSGPCSDKTKQKMHDAKIGKVSLLKDRPSPLKGILRGPSGKQKTLVVLEESNKIPMVLEVLMVLVESKKTLEESNQKSNAHIVV